MRTTSLAALALLIAGCGIDPAPTAPEDPGLPFPDPQLLDGLWYRAGGRGGATREPVATVEVYGPRSST